MLIYMRMMVVYLFPLTVQKLWLLSGCSEIAVAVAGNNAKIYSSSRTLTPQFFPLWAYTHTHTHPSIHTTFYIENSFHNQKIIKMSLFSYNKCSLQTCNGWKILNYLRTLFFEWMCASKESYFSDAECNSDVLSIEI